ncbi:MAG: IS1634 family transposase [Actinomycetota bacterium]
MFLKRATVRQGARTYVYLQLVRSFREGGRVRQKVVATLGREDELKASGQLDALTAAFARVDPPRLGIRREVGPLLLVNHYLERLGLPAIVDNAIPQHGRAQLTHGEVVVALIANRLCSPSPLYDISGWGSQAALHELFSIPGMLLNDDRLGRALDALAPVAEHVRGAATLAAIERFGVDAARLHLDLTTLRFAGAYEDSSLVSKGWGADRRVARQVRVLEATTKEGIPLYVRPHAGSAAELTCIGQALERLTELLPRGLVVCADSAFGHLKNLCEAQRAGLRFVVPLREATGFRGRFLEEVGFDGLHRLRYTSRRDRARRPAERTLYKGALRPFAVTDPDTGEIHSFRVVYVWSSEEAASVSEGRERALTKAEDALGRVQRGLGGRYYKTKKDVDSKVAQILAPVAGLITATTGTREGRPTLSFGRNEDAIKKASAADGVYALATNLPGRLSATQVLKVYKDQTLVELRHRDLKQTLKVRPVFLHNDDRIAALVSVVGLAVLVFGLIEADVRKALGDDEELPGLLPEGRAARPTGRNILAAFQGLGLTYTPDGITLDRLTHTQRRLLELLGIEVPWPDGKLELSNCGKRG